MSHKALKVQGLRSVLNMQQNIFLLRINAACSWQFVLSGQGYSDVVQVVALQSVHLITARLA